MVAYNFQPRFADAVAAGRKCQTMRRRGKRRHARAGEPVQLYTGMRTKACRKLVDPDPMCIGVDDIEIDIGISQIEEMRINGAALDGHEREAFARDDGFPGEAEFHEWLVAVHGSGRFEGVVVRWRQPLADPRHEVDQT